PSARRGQWEMREDPEVKFPMEIEQGTDAEIGEILHSQRMAFTARRNNVLRDIAGITERINVLNERIQGSNVQLDAVKRQMVLLDDEINTKAYLLQTGLVRKPEL